MTGFRNTFETLPFDSFRRVSGGRLYDGPDLKLFILINNNNNNNNISLFREDNILSIAYLTYGPLQVKQYNYLQISYLQKD